MGFDTSGDPTNLLPVNEVTYAGDWSLATGVTFNYDNIGNVLTTSDSLGNVTRYRYDAARQLIGVVGQDPDGGGPLKNRAIRFTYNGSGRIILTERGTVPSQSDSDWANFSTLVAQSTTYDSVGRRASDSFASGGATYAMTQYAYDTANRLQCTAVRMNVAAFGSSPPACQLGTTGVYGPDRITYDVYDLAGQLTQVATGYATGSQRNEALTQYGADGEVTSKTDGKGDLTTFIYDGLLRLSKIEFPTPSNGSVSSTTDYEQYGYDANGNITADRRRDGQTITYGYDADNHQISGANGASYGYDALGRITSATVGGITSSLGYDALSRVVSETGPLGTVTSQYDILGRKTRLTWPDGFYINYAYDAVGEATSITESSGYVPTSYSYDDLGRPISIMRSDQVSTAFGYGTDQDLVALDHYFPNTGYNEYYTFTDNPAGQLQSFTSSNAGYNFASNVSASSGYSSDGQNRYTSVGGLGFSYDGRGNLSSNGVTSYGYDVLNRLTNLSSGATLTYDAAGRLYQTTGASTTRFLYDGTQIIGEYDGSGNLLRRYAPGPAQEPVAVWYEGASTTDRRRLLADRLGSTIAVTNEAGALLAIDTYDALGVAGPNNIGRFQFAGMPWLPDEGLYHAQARAYSPALGRFMQSDPIGYGDGLNFYNYAHSDSVNATDLTGTYSCVNIPSPADDPCEIPVTATPPPQLIQVSVQLTNLTSFSPPNITGLQSPGEGAQSTTCAGALRTAGQSSAAVARANSSMSTLSQAASANGIDPALLAAIGVRETGFQNIPEVGGGPGMGVFQLTNQQGVTSAQAYNVAFAANYAASMLSSNMRYLSNKFPAFTSLQLLQATAAAYNFGTGNISGNPNTIDVGTSPKGAGNYGSNVVNLMSCFSH